MFATPCQLPTGGYFSGLPLLFVRAMMRSLGRGAAAVLTVVRLR